MIFSGAKVIIVRILILLNRIPFPLNDGGAIGAFNFVRGYVEAGCELSVLAMNTTKHFVDLKTFKHPLLERVHLHTVSIDNRIKPFKALLNLFGSMSYVVERFQSVLFEEKLKELLIKNEYDVVHIDGIPPALYIPLVRKYSDAKISMRAHNVEHLIWKRIATNEKNVVKKWYVNLQAERLKLFERKAVKSCDVVMAISQEDKQSLWQLAQTDNIIIVPAGMDITEERPQVNDEVNPLTFIGSFDWMPNLQGVEWFFDEIWNRLLARFPDLKFQIAGKKMTDKIWALQSESVQPLGEVPDSKAFILNGGIMVVPIISGSGIRIKILEGMALGKCILATTIAAEGLGVTDDENILIADTFEQFEEKIKRCLEVPSYRKRIAENAHKFALENFQNKKVFERLIAHYRSILK